MFLLLLFAALVRGSCYTPDGTLSKDVPCDPTSEHSVCCTAGFMCMSNGLCQDVPSFSQGSNRYIRGTCTDKDWRAPECGEFCITGNPSGGEWAMLCNKDAEGSADGEWCCQFEDCCSNKRAARLDIGEALVTATAGKRQATTTQGVEPSSSADKDASKSTVTTETSSSGDEDESQPTASQSSEPSSSVTKGQPQSTLNSSATSTTEPETTSSPPPQPNEEDSDSPDILPIALGAGLGGAGLVAVVAVGICLWRRRRRRRQYDQSPSTDVSYPKNAYEVDAPVPPQELYGQPIDLHTRMNEPVELEAPRGYGKG